MDLAKLLDWVCESWDLPEEGIWGTRGGQQKLTYRRLMGGIALDRAIRLADRHGPPAHVSRWLEARNAIYEQIMAEGWHPERQAFRATRRHRRARCLLAA